MHESLKYFRMIGIFPVQGILTSTSRLLGDVLHAW